MLLSCQDRVLTKNAARFYSACLTLALIHMADLGILHRDLKPDNMVVDSKGYAKVIDFGLAKITKETNTMCGTHDYVAPEVLRTQASGRCYRRGVDLWSLGVIVYELLAGYTPFRGPTEVGNDKVLENVSRGDFAFPATNFDETSKKFVRSLLQKDAKKRLGMGRHGAHELMWHPFFAGFDFEQFMGGTMTPPWVPQLESATDTKYFNPTEKDFIIDLNHKDESGWDKDWST
jgi:serine/threonine protein kinase